MKPLLKFRRVLSLTLALIVLTNCTVYNRVQESPKYIDHHRTMILHKDELRFSLLETTTRSDTLYGKISHHIVEPVFYAKMIVVLKPDQQLEQDSLGTLIIPFSSIDYIEYYKKDLRKSDNQTAIAITVGIVAGIMVFVLVPVLVMGGLADHLNP